jgi:phytol kinase
MKQQLLYLLVFFAGYLLFIVFCEYLNRKRNIASEYTRKLAHIVLTLSALSYTVVFEDKFYPLILCFFCGICFLAANYKKLLSSIDGVERKTTGSYMLAWGVGISYYLAVQFNDFSIYNLAILILAICDPLAGIVGNAIKSKRIVKNKTLAGSLSFLLSAGIISFIYLQTSGYNHVWEVAILISLSATLAELISQQGTDNMTIPLTVSGILIIVY